MAVRLRGVRKRFEAVEAVAGVDLDIPRGSFFELVGPNGAGKTTLLSMVTGLLRPDAGTVEVEGRDVWRDPRATRARIGMLPDGLPLFDRLTGEELLRFRGRLRKLPEHETRRRTEDLLGVLDLHSAATTLVVDCSAGMRKKIGLAVALLHNPRVSSSTSPSSPSTRSPPAPSARCSSATPPAARRWSCPAIPWTWSSGPATRWP